jgi:ketosteroid isomerase-like protein
LVRLRDEVRSEAEREALEIVTTARRDVRRIVVEARRELLVLTAQLHAAIESVDQRSLQAAAETASGPIAQGQSVADALTGQRSLVETEDLVLGARREVRSVLDEARAEIEALVAEANGPLREIPAALTASSSTMEPPIPTLETILGADPLARGSGPSAAPSKPESGPYRIESVPRNERKDDRGPDDGRGEGHSGPWRQAGEPRAATPTESFSSAVSSNLALSAPVPTAAPLPTPAALPTPAPTLSAPVPAPVASASAPAMAMASPAFVSRDSEDAVSFIVAPPDAPQYFGRFATEELAAEPLSGFGDTGPIQTEPGRSYFADYDEGPPSRPAWMWVGLFAATGVFAIVGTVWWFTLRDSGTALATAAPDGADATPIADVTPAATRLSPARAATVSGSALAIEVRRTAWLRTVIDGNEESRVYQAGEKRQIDGARAVSIRAGDGGAVFVSVNGRPPEALGASGVAVTRQYALAGGSASPAPVVATAPAASTPGVEPVATAQQPPPAPLPAQPRPTETARGATPPPAAAPPAPAVSPTAPVPAPETTAAAPAGGGRADLIAAGQQWLDAYQRRDREAMGQSGTENMTVSDERSVTERFPAWQVGVRRDLDQLELELSGDTALLTARMTERNGDGATAAAQHVSRVSQIWVRRNGRWRLADVRIIGEARLNQIVR